MLSGITFWTSDKIWHGILADLGAAPAGPDLADLVFAPEEYAGAPTVLELKSKIVAEIDRERAAAVKKACGATASVSTVQAKIICLLERAGKRGVSAEVLRRAMGYSPGANTRALDTAVYNLRKIFGADFIKTEKGKFVRRGP